MLKFNLIILAIMLGLSAKAQRQVTLPDQAILLNEAYQSKSTEKLLAFFNNWRQEIPTVTDAELEKMNDTIREVYKAYNAFYHIKEIKKLGGFRNTIPNSFYDNAHFLVIQNKLEIYRADKVYWSETEMDSVAVSNINSSMVSDVIKKSYLQRRDGKLSRNALSMYGPNGEMVNAMLSNKKLTTIDNFRPMVDTENKPAVYLSQKYYDILHPFLGNSSDVFVGDDPKIKQLREEIPAKHKFVETQIKILKWTGDHLNSEPYVQKITIDKNMKYARVNYTIWTEGGEAYLRNDNGKWVLQSAKALWIE